MRWLLGATALPVGLLGALVVAVLGYGVFVTTWGVPAGAAESGPLPDGLSLLLERRSVSPLGLAEYRRALALRSGGREVLRTELTLDHGGVDVVNVYRVAGGALLAVDRVSAVELDPGRRVAREVVRRCDDGRPEGGTYLGAFATVREGEGRRFRFVPASERPDGGVEPDGTLC